MKQEKLFYFGIVLKIENKERLNETLLVFPMIIVWLRTKRYGQKRSCRFCYSASVIAQFYNFKVFNFSLVDTKPHQCTLFMKSVLSGCSRIDV